MGAQTLRLGPSGVARSVGFVTGPLLPMAFGFGMAINAFPTGPVQWTALGILAVLGVGIYRHFAAAVIFTTSRVRRWTWFRYHSVDRDALRDFIQIGDFWAPKLGNAKVMEVVRRDGRSVKLWPTAAAGLTEVQSRVPAVEAWLRGTQ